MARVRLKTRFWVLLVSVLMLAAGAIVFFMLRGPEGDLNPGSMRLSLDVNAVIIRDEDSLTTEKYDKILFDVAEGTAVAEGEQIAQVFRWGYQDSTMQSLLDVRAEIYEYQLGKVEGIINPELDSVNAQTSQALATIRAAAKGNTPGDLLTLEQSLKSLLATRMDMLRQIQSDETLDALYQQEQMQLDNLATWKRDIVSAGAGTVSFYFDGYEQALSAAKLDVINADLIANVLKGGANATSIAAGAESRPLYRLIDSDHFYIAFLTGATSPLRLAEGETYTVIFEGYADQPFQATAHATIVGAKQVVNLLEFQQDMGDLLGVRTVKANILLDATGFQVPLDALSVLEGEPGLTLLAGDTSTWTMVDVLAVDEENAIIRQREGAGELAAGQRFKRS